jgi:hypothetical protein
MPAFHVSPCDQCLGGECDSIYRYGPSNEDEQGRNASREEPRPVIREGCNSHDTNGIDHG